jgi:hypothetical protein
MQKRLVRRLHGFDRVSPDGDRASVTVIWLVSKVEISLKAIKMG